MIADALDHCVHARVAHRESLAGKAAEECLAGRGAIEHRVADEHVLLGPEASSLRRPDRDDPARETLAGVVVGLAAKREGHSGRQPGCEALAGRAGERDLDRPLGQAMWPPAPRDVPAQDPAHGAVDVSH